MDVEAESEGEVDIIEARLLPSTPRGEEKLQEGCYQATSSP
jgi:hypothetical protein